MRKYRHGPDNTHRAQPLRLSIQSNTEHTKGAVNWNPENYACGRLGRFLEHFYVQKRLLFYFLFCPTSAHKTTRLYMFYFGMRLMSRMSSYRASSRHLHLRFSKLIQLG